jgi:hypothetical protein
MKHEFPFIKTEILRMEPTGKRGDGMAEFSITLRCTLKWWLPSYWAWLRSNIQAEPSWLAWPMAILFAFRYGPKFKSEAQ